MLFRQNNTTVYMSSSQLKLAQINTVVILLVLLFVYFHLKLLYSMLIKLYSAYTWDKTNVVQFRQSFPASHRYTGTCLSVTVNDVNVPDQVIYRLMTAKNADVVHRSLTVGGKIHMSVREVYPSNIMEIITTVVIRHICYKNQVFILNTWTVLWCRVYANRWRVI